MVSNEIKQMLKRENEKTKIPVTPSMRRKIGADKFFIPLINEASEFAKYNYSIAQLKEIAKHYKLPVSGTKTQLTTMIYNFLFLSEKTVKIQSIVRGFFTRKILEMRGPALINRDLCTNQTDFLSLSDIKEIPCSQFYSFKCPKGFIYGFDMVSLAQLFVSSAKNKRIIASIMNPYNRETISPMVYKSLKDICRLSKLFGINMNVSLVPEKNEVIEEEFNFEQRILGICQTLDEFGNYTNTDWFMNLTRSNMVQFLRELHDIWCYRAQLSLETRREICPPHGNPFAILRQHTNMLTTMSNDELKRAFIIVIEKIITSSNDISNRSLGGMYILTALTITNPSAAAAMPWLYESVMN